jgi:hypothetical protein
MSEERNYEAEAKAMGHVSQEEWKGDPKRWTPAKEFVEKGENILPILRKRVEGLEGDLKSVTSHNKKEIAEVKRIAEETAYKRAKAEYDQKMHDLDKKELDAFQEGDAEKFQKVKQEKQKLEEPEKVTATPAKDVDANNPDPVFVKWQEKNGWYGDDDELALYADAVGTRIAQANPDITFGEILPQVTDKVKAAFPHKFENERRKDPGNVESGGSGKQKNGNKSFNDLPAEAKASFKRLEARFKEQGRKYTKEEYTAEYLAQ